MRYWWRITLFLLLLLTVCGYSDRSTFTKTVTVALEKQVNCFSSKKDRVLFCASMEQIHYAVSGLCKRYHYPQD